MDHALEVDRFFALVTHHEHVPEGAFDRLLARPDVGRIAVVAGHTPLDVVCAVVAMEGKLAVAIVAEVDVDHLIA